MSRNGRLIVICGIDGAGKSTQEVLLGDRLRQEGGSVFHTKSPTDWYRQDAAVHAFLTHGTLTLRPETLGILAAADRMRQYDTEISPCLRNGVDVICNRYVYSTYGYFRMRGADTTFIDAVNRLVPRPDKAVLLVIDPVVAVQRVHARKGRVNHEERDADYLGKVQREIVRRWPPEFPVLDGARRAEDLSDAIHAYVSG
jgi:dTMP kinase